MKKIMKKTLLFAAFLFFVFCSKAQENENTLPRLVKDTLYTTSGYRLAIGDNVTFGTGSTDDGDFKFIRRNSTGFGTMMVMTNNNGYNKSQLSLGRAFAGHKAKVVKFVTRGTKKSGEIFQPLINVNSVRFEIDIDNAIKSGELVVPEEYKPKSNSSILVVQPASVADELMKLKKLLDDGILTQEEYDIQKKKLLEKN